MPLKRVMNNIEDVFPDGHWATEEEYVIRCPVCSDGNHNHCYLRPDKNVYHCKYNGCSGALSWLVRTFGPKGQGIYQPQPQKRLKRAVKETKFDSFYKVTGRDGSMGVKALAYL